MEKLIKIIVSPFNPSMEVVDDIVVQVHVPYSEKGVTIKINPAVEDYKENQDKPNIKIRQLTVTRDTVQTETLNFDFSENNVHKVTINEKNYKIKLMSTGKENIQGQEFSYFEFLISS